MLTEDDGHHSAQGGGTASLIQSISVDVGLMRPSFGKSEVTVVMLCFNAVIATDIASIGDLQTGSLDLLLYIGKGNGCGGYFNESSGSFTSPNYPSNYDNGVTCDYLFFAGDGETITVTFDDFSLEISTNCRYDKISIYDGSSVADPLLGQWCGTDSPGVVVGVRQSLLIRFESDFSVSFRGFSASYVIEPPETGDCGHVFTKSTGQFTSPNFPSNYGNNERCSFKIEATAGETVTLSFDSFDLESHISCAYDAVEIRDGNGNLLQKACGSGVPDPITSTNNGMIVEFTSDSSITRGGFEASYIKQTNIASIGDLQTGSLDLLLYIGKGNAGGGFSLPLENGLCVLACRLCCGGYFNESSGSFTSPNYPSNYDNGVTCDYLFFAGDGETITVTFDDFSLEISTNCRYDKISIYDGSSVADPLLGQWCGTDSPGVVVGVRQSLLIRFESDFSVSFRGFSASYVIEPPETGDCGHVFTKSTGQFTSPNFPSNYGNNERCSFKIEAAAGETVTLSFDSFDLESHISCAYDAVEIRDGNGNLLQKACGSGVPDPITSTNNGMIVEFTSDSSITRGGFEASYIKQ
ncbi:dorsal-ventral patterning tolloid-like protein 1 [Diadema antillarum]|uniref:dorsal-ventral patterning tolloid-like protein 1 n=1 Tax=Diadema antillarum TaxID=105358 RepID=UPI003A8AFA29